MPLDIDGDGDLDLALLSLQGLRFYENRSAPKHFARVKLEATSGSRTALGAIVRLRAGGLTRNDHVKVNEGFQSQMPGDLHFGLGDAERVESLRVEWPSGAVQVWRELPADRLLVLTEGERNARIEELPHWPAKSDAARAADPARALTEWVPEVASSGTQVVHWIGELGSFNRPERYAEEEWILVAPRESAADALERVRASLPDAFRIVRASPAAIEATFGKGEAPVVPSTFVFHSGALRRSFLREVDEAEVRALLESLREEEPYPELLIWTARRALDVGEFESAGEMFMEAIEIDPGMAVAFEGRGRSHVALGELNAAELAYARSVEADPDYALGHYNLGVTRSQLGRPAEAIEPLREALRIQGENLLTLLALGEACSLSDQGDLALDAFQRAARSDPSSADAHLLCGKVLGQLGRYPEAIASLERCLELDPEETAAQRALELCRRLMGEG